MLSPWSMQAWKTQQLKYAAGTYDIMLRGNPLFQRGMPWRTKLHYAATFWSYLMVLWVPILLMAPALSLVTGIAPIETYSVEFFLHILPLLIVNEVAMLVACKGYDVNAGRTLAICLLPLRIKALCQVVLGHRPGFPPTPKHPIFTKEFRHILPSAMLVLAMVGAGCWGSTQYAIGAENYTVPFLVVNLFWLTWNILSVGRVLVAAYWRPGKAYQNAILQS